MRRWDERACWIALAALGAALCGWLGLASFAWNDYETEARPAFEALAGGHLSSFLQLAPAYGGSLVLRAPFALLPGLWGGGALAVYRAVAAPGLLALAALGAWLALRLRRSGQSRALAAVVLALCAANPIAVYALEYGHPEDLLCAVLAIAAVLCACEEHPLWAGALAGLAFATKAWGVIALAPALAALPRGRVRALASAGLCAALVLCPLVLARSSQPLAGAGSAAAQTGSLFQPQQLWWWLGSPVHPERSGSGSAKGAPTPPAASARPGYRAAPGWVTRVAHPLIALVPIPLSLLWLLKRRRRWDALALLALALLLRCLLDPWDNVYYTLPLLLALTAWEPLARKRPPLLALAATMAVAASFELAPSYLSADGQSLVFAAWAVPLAGALALALYGPIALADRLQLLGQLGKPLRSLLADDHEILDPHAQAPG